nr:hypothetical protein [uncultured Dethiosulfovibrio sp.]
MGELFEDLSKVRLEELCTSDRLRAWYLLDLENIGASVLIMETPEGIVLLGNGAPGKERLVQSGAPGYAYNAEWFASEFHPDYLTEHFLGWRDRHDKPEGEKIFFNIADLVEVSLSRREEAARSRLIAIHRAFRALYEG